MLLWIVVDLLGGNGDSGRDETDGLGEVDLSVFPAFFCHRRCHRRRRTRRDNSVPNSAEPGGRAVRGVIDDMNGDKGIGGTPMRLERVEATNYVRGK